MELKDLLELQRHDKIKFVGDPNKYNLDEIFGVYGYDYYTDPKDPTKSFLKRGKKYVVSYVETPQHWHREEEKKLIGNGLLVFYKGKVKIKDPADWELVERRHNQVTTNINTKHGLRGAQRTLHKIRNAIEEQIKMHHNDFEQYLNQIALPEKLKFLSELSGEDKILADLLFEFEDMHTFLKDWNKGKPNEE